MAELQTISAILGIVKNTWHVLEFAQSAFHARSDARHLWKRTTDLYLLIEKIDLAMKGSDGEIVDKEILTIVQNTLTASTRTIDELARRCLNLGDKDDLTAISRITRPISFTLSAKSIQKFEYQLQTHIVSMQIAFVLIDRGEKQHLTRMVTEVLHRLDSTINSNGPLPATSSIPIEDLVAGIETPEEEIAVGITTLSVPPISLGPEDELDFGCPIRLLTSEETNAWRDISNQSLNMPVTKRRMKRSLSSVALINLVKQDFKSEVQAMLNDGVDVNGTDKHGHTALYAAVKHDRLAISTILLSHGADIIACPPHTPLLLAMQTNRADFVKLFLESQPNIDLDDVDAAGWTLLHHAVHYALSAALSSLLELTRMRHLKLNLNAQCNLSWTPLMHLAERAHVPYNLHLATQLLENGADVDEPDDNGYTALYYAVTSGAATTHRIKFVAL
ncbi:ankyrin repeat-containing domain protein [Paraphoma chrysanthemicola]|uniref:Ankyrin repeat-containing domain protein n=1 Tax=Paraphoma chrysanthemicola TaxID=798071 RepID=A0A8K0W521_9PLEO|nr:ankyrin repeat-containing domain protein [Paraphoma chrysanthemicola]